MNDSEHSYTLLHIKEDAIEAPPNDLFIISGSLIYDAKKVETIESMIIIYVDIAKPYSKRIIYFAKHLATMGYVCMVPVIFPIRNPNFLDGRVEGLDFIIKNIDFLKGPIKTITNIGLIGHSQTCEICSIWTSQAISESIVKGILAVCPAFGETHPIVSIPIFTIIGDKDPNANLVSWDRSYVDKSGVILSKGLHSGYFSPFEPEQDRVATHGYWTNQNNLQYQILFDSATLFFGELFYNEKSNQLNVLNVLKSKYSQFIRILYQNTKKSVIEGSDFDTKNLGKIELKPWIGQLFVGHKAAPIADYDLKYNFDEQQIYTRFLYNGLDNVTNIFHLAAYIVELKAYIQQSSETHVIGQTKKTADVYQHDVVDKTLQVIRNAFEGAKDDNQIPIERQRLPILLYLKSFILQSINSNNLHWSKLCKLISERSYGSLFFLSDLLMILRQLTMDPWNHAAFGREIIWQLKHDSRFKARYIIDLHKDEDNYAKFRYLSLRLGQSFLDQKVTLGNTIGKSQIIYVYFHTKQGINTPYEIEVKPPSVLSPSSSLPNIIPKGTEDLILGNYTHQQQIKCYLDFHLIPLPKDQQITSIELQFQNPSGAIMLSEVAFTN